MRRSSAAHPGAMDFWNTMRLQDVSAIVNRAETDFREFVELAIQRAYSGR